MLTVKKVCVLVGIGFSSQNIIFPWAKSRPPQKQLPRLSHSAWPGLGEVPSGSQSCLS